MGSSCRGHKHPKRKKPVSRAKIERELLALYRQAGLEGPLRIKFTKDLEATHEHNRRRYAQVRPFDDPPTFEFAPQTVWLPDRHRRALLAHEVGHVLDPEGGEDDADAAAECYTGVKIGYDRRWPGKGLQVSENPSLNGPEEEFRRLLRESRAELVASGKHLKFRLPNGRILVMSRTPSDHRAWQNILRDLKRLLKEPPRARSNPEKNAHELFAEFRGPEKHGRYTINAGRRLSLTDWQRQWRLDTKINAVVVMDANDFLRLTEDLDHVDDLFHEALSVEDYNRLTHRQPPVYLEINLAPDGVSGRVVGHEGRHRAISQLKAQEPLLEVSIRLLMDHAPDRDLDVYDLPVYWYPQDQRSDFVFDAKKLYGVAEANVQERYQREPRIENRDMEYRELVRMLNAKLMEAGS